MTRCPVAIRRFNAFAEGVDLAPPGTHVLASNVRTAIGDAADDFMRAVRALGLQADSCDLIHAVEVAMYDYVKASNLESNALVLAEGFGDAMSGPARDRVMAQALQDQAFIARMTE